MYVYVEYISPFHLYIYSNKKEKSDFHGIESFDPVKMLHLKIKPICLSTDTQAIDVVT